MTSVESARCPLCHGEGAIPDFIESFLPAAMELSGLAIPTTVAGVAREEERQATEPVEVPERLRTPPEPRRDRCTWTRNGVGNWDTQCGLSFELVAEGTPEGNRYRFCPGCGMVLIEAPECEHCGGEGEVRPVVIGPLAWVTCPACRGRGHRKEAARG
jgi:hypothetical protein